MVEKKTEPLASLMLALFIEEIPPCEDLTLLANATTLSD